MVSASRVVCFFKQKTAYEMRISDGSSDVCASDRPELGIGSGLSDVELGLRLRYEFAREFAPYVGVNWERNLGETGRFARAQGARAAATSLVMGVRFWF